MVNFGPVAAEIVSLVWGTRDKFQRVSRLGSVTARHLQDDPKNLAQLLFCMPELYQILANFQNYFTTRIRRNL